MGIIDLAIEYESNGYNHFGSLDNKIYCCLLHLKLRVINIIRMGNLFFTWQFKFNFFYLNRILNKDSFLIPIYFFKIKFI